ncbi:MAG: NADH:ubiquinone reductase (Na(+)-transporting) subunit A [Planctomycetota bacterium]|nr:NADH:ubiquinone reductase (Na(+)-transporting) subunit A [Planctomycetota bacterium]
MPWRGRKSNYVRIRRGLDLAISGAPRQVIEEGGKISRVAVLRSDFPEVRPAMQIAVGDRVAVGETLFVDRRRPRIAFTAPASGRVLSIISNEPSGKTQCVEIQVEGEATKTLEPLPPDPTRDEIQTWLLTSGMWPALRARPFGGIPDPGTVPSALFVTAMDSNPLAAAAEVVIAAYQADFAAGLEILKHLTDGPLHVCQAPGPALASGAVTFAGPHPAGLPGTHIHFLRPVGGGHTVWHVNYQDTIAIGHLFRTGRFWTDRVIALAGPGVREPRLCRTRVGASIEDLTSGHLQDGNLRVITGSVLSGREEPYLGRYHLQVSVIGDGGGSRRKSFGSWLATRSRRGRIGPLIPLASFDRVMPVDLVVVPLLRAISVGDRDTAQRLGCLELVEEDVALLTYVCPGNRDYGRLLRRVLDDIKADR